MNDLEKRRAALIAYARSCLDSGDWHGCRDACTDLEVIEARLEERAGRDDRHGGLSIRVDDPEVGRYYPNCPCSDCLTKQAAVRIRGLG